MNGSSLRAIARHGSIGTALLLFAAAGQAMATGTIMGKLTVPAGQSLDMPVVVATSDTYKIYRADVGADGTYSTDVDPGTYTVAVVADGFDASPAANVVVADGKTVTEDFPLKVATPFCVVKSPNPIPLTDDINSASFMDAADIVLNGGQNVVVPDDPNGWTPTFLSGRFRFKYSTQAIHVAADVTFKQPRVNNQTDGNLWNGNAFEFGFQNDPYDPARTDNDPNHDWQLVVGLGNNPDWWLHENINARPTVNGMTEPLSNHFAIQDKATKDGELFRLDIPWSILLQGDATGKPISPPKDNDLGAMDVVIDAAGPNSDLTMADRNTGGFQLSWGGYARFQSHPNLLRPIQFCPQAPAAPKP